MCLESLNPKSISSSETDLENVSKKLTSKSLNSINDRKSSSSNKVSSSVSSLPFLNASSSSASNTKSSTSSSNNELKSNDPEQPTESQIKHNDSQAKPTNKFKPKNNLSATTTLEISSYTSDSLFNSHLILTPICSEAISPSQLGLANSYLKSPLIQHGSPCLQTTTPKSKPHMFGHQQSNNDDTGRLSMDLNSHNNKIGQSPSPPPPPPPPVPQEGSCERQKINFKLNALFPSPPPQANKYIINNVISQSSPSELFPLPPIFVENNKTCVELELSQISVANTETCPAPAPAPVVVPETKKPSKHNVFKSTEGSIIGAITARLNLKAGECSRDKTKIEKAYTGLGSLFKKTVAANASLKSSKPVEAEKSNTESTNLQINSQKCSSNVLIENHDTILSTSLYGLDKEEDTKSLDSDRHFLNSGNLNELSTIPGYYLHQSNNNNNFGQYNGGGGGSCQSLPSPPNGFEDEQAIEQEESVKGCETYENINEFEMPKNQLHTSTSNNLSFPLPPSCIHNSSANNSLSTTLTPATSNNEIILPAKHEQMQQQHQSTSSSFSTVIHNSILKCSGGRKSQSTNSSPKGKHLVKAVSPTRQHWNHLNCETLSINQAVTSLLPENNFSEKQKMLDNHLNGGGLNRTHIEVKRSSSFYSNVAHNKLNRSCPALSDKHGQDELIGGSTAREFKLDHLLDINPKRLYKNCKFRCKIHDVINERGQFWLEVIYSKEDERKFYEIFKLFRLCSKISEPPSVLYPEMRVSAFYKDDWHRAIVVDSMPNCDAQVKIKVRLVDLGIVKLLDRYTELREIDQKFFNCPLKALQCTINIDEMEQGLPSRKPFRFTKDSRKCFTRLIYKRVLFAKIVDFDYDGQVGQDKAPICQIVLGCQFQRGIIDIYMYLLSKFDRPRYECFKKLHSQQKKTAKSLGTSDQIETDNETVTNSQTNTTTSCQSLEHAAELHVDTQNVDRTILNSDILQVLREEFIQSYGLRNQMHDNAAFDELDADEIFTEDEYTEPEMAMYANDSVYNCNNRLHETLVFSSDSSESRSFYSVNQEVDFEEQLANTRLDLDYTPVKGDSDEVIFSKNTFFRSPNNSYKPLKIDPVNLPSLMEVHTDLNKADTIGKNPEQTTILIKSRNRLHEQIKQFNLTPVMLPPSHSIKPTINRLVASSHMHNASDTDSSLQQATCCTKPLKFRW